MTMKIKKIRIKSRTEFDSDLRTVARNLDQGITPKKKVGEYFESLDAVRAVLTDKRLELWRTIRDKKPSSISTLTGMVDRGFKPVYRDLLLLESLGLITFKKTKGERGDRQAPISLVDELQLAVA
jgi:predicted transcriptional regulator